MDAQRQPVSGYADIGGAQIYYEAAGAGHPLLLLHAGIADSRMWDAQWAEFASRYRVIRLDLPGYGRSQLPDRPTALHEWGAGMLRFLGVGRAHVLGISFGGRFALDLALAHPDLVGALVLVCPSVGGEQASAAVREFGDEEEALLERGDIDGATELNLRMWVDGPHRAPGQVDPALRERVREMQRHAFTIPTPPGFDLLPLEPPAIERLAELRSATLVLVGDLDIADKLELAGRLAAEIPGARQVVIPGAAHMVSMEQPAAFNRAVLDFLAEQG